MQFLPGITGAQGSHSGEGMGLSNTGEASSRPEASGFGLMLTNFKLNDATTDDGLPSMPLQLGRGGQLLPLERQGDGFQGVSSARQALLELNTALNKLGDRVSELMSLDEQQQASLNHYLTHELGLSKSQQEEVMTLLENWQDSPPRLVMSASELELAGASGRQEVEGLTDVLLWLEQELAVWVGQAQSDADNANTGMTLDDWEALQNNPYLAAMALGENRPKQGSPKAADFLANTMQLIMNTANSRTLPMTLEPGRPEALLLSTELPQQTDKSFNLQLFEQARSVNTESRMESALPGSADTTTVPGTERFAVPLREERAPAPTIESVQRPLVMAQAGTAVAERIMVMVQGEIRNATIRLDPPELGMMDIRIQVQNDQTQVQIMVQSPQVREALESQSMRLREFLEQQGLSLSNLDVSDQEQRDQRQQAGEESEGLAGRDSEDSGNEAVSGGEQRSVGLVDQFV